MYRLTSRILDVSNVFQNKCFPIHESVCVSSPSYYLDCSEKSYPNVPLNRYGSTFCLQQINDIQETKPAGRQWNPLINSVIKIIIYKKSTIYHDTSIMISSYVTVSCLTVTTDNVLNIDHNETTFTELRRLLKNILILKSKNNLSLSTQIS